MNLANCLENGVQKLLDGAIGVSPDSAMGLRDFDSLVALLNRYCDEIELFNPAYGLVSVKDRTELAVKHILDSLAPVRTIIRTGAARFSASPVIADAGSGAGLPGIPLAIALPGVTFALIERMGRRAGFLRNTAAVLALKNVEILETDIEKAPPGAADMVCFRAFRPLEPKILKKLFRLLKPGACLAAYKGRRNAIDAEMLPLTEFLKLQNAEWRAVRYDVPFLPDERNLVLIHT
jgi:16S rRNA (guanine527-N7)-methyltransferase